MSRSMHQDPGHLLQGGPAPAHSHLSEPSLSHLLSVYSPVTLRAAGQALLCSSKHPQPLVQYPKHERCPIYLVS